jgi:hypothetical protein
MRQFIEFIFMAFGLSIFSLVETFIFCQVVRDFWFSGAIIFGISLPYLILKEEEI